MLNEPDRDPAILRAAAAPAIAFIAENRDPALRASRSTAWPPANVTTAGPKPAGNKLRLRAAGIGHDEGGGRVERGATADRRRGNGERPPYPARGGRLGRFAPPSAPSPQQLRIPAGPR